MRLKFLTLTSVACVAAIGGLTACDQGVSNAASPKATQVKTGGPARDWTTVVSATPEGGFRMGNPDARAKLIEYASFTCPACRNFHVDGTDKLKADYIKSGRVSYEYRPFPLNVIDIGAVLLARCNGPNAFFGFTDAYYRNFDSWTAPFTKITPEQGAAVNKLPQDRLVKAVADIGGLDAFARARGVPQSRYDQCLTDGRAITQLTAAQKTAVDTYQIQGTPTFILNGSKLENAGRWSDVEPRLREATA